MITCRIGISAESPLHAIAVTIDRAVRSSPLAPIMDGLVLIGLGDPYLIQPDDPRPRVVVPLAWAEPLDPIARSQAQSSQALVFLDHEELGRVIPGGEWDGLVTVLAAAGTHDAWRLLRGVGVFENVSAIEVLRERASARGLLERFRGEIPTPPLDLEALVDGILELTVAANIPPRAPAAE